MNKSILTLVIVLTICAMLLPGQPAAAQVPEAAAADAGLTATVTDLFGYATAVTPYNWVEIFDAGGTKQWPITGIDYNTVFGQTINLPPGGFWFYENLYTKVNLCSDGYITFNDTMDCVNIDPSASLTFPSQDDKSNIISATGQGSVFVDPDAGIYTATVGTDFVIEWYNIRTPTGVNANYQIILEGDGDIKIQIKAYNTNADYAVAGIEHKSQKIGLTAATKPEGSALFDPAGGNAILIKRPGDATRNFLLGGGSFLGAPGELINPEITLLEMSTGAGISDDPITVSSDKPFCQFLDFQNPGTVASIDIPASPGTMLPVLLLAGLPPNASPGDVFRCNITASRMGAEPSTVTVSAMVPYNFAQTYFSGIPQTGQVSNNAFISATNKIFNQSVYGELNENIIAQPAVTLLGNEHYVAVYIDATLSERGVSSDIVLKAQVFDLHGAKVGAPVTITTLPLETNSDKMLSDIAVATSPAGEVGISWTELNTDTSVWVTQNQIKFAVMGTDGALKSGPITVLDVADTPDTWVEFEGNRIAVNDNGIFGLVWARGTYASNAVVEYDVWFTAYDSAGIEVQPKVNVTNEVQG